MTSTGARPSGPIPPDASIPVSELEVRDVMTPGVVTIVEDASLLQAGRALERHGVHAVLVVGHSTGRPIGWVTARGLLGHLHSDPSMVMARDAVVERPVPVSPTATVSEAVGALSRDGVSHLLVMRDPDSHPEGVLSDADLAPVICGRAP